MICSEVDKVKIGIAGAGGIGSNVAMHLVRSGIHRIKVVDYDKVENSNLNRQFYFADQIGKYKVDMLYDNLKRIDEKAKIEKIVLKLDETNIADTFYDCDIVVEAFDKKECKKMLIEAFSTSDKTLISASGIAGLDITKVSQKKLGNCYIVGDFLSDTDNEAVYSPKVMLVACIMSNIIIELVNK